MAAVAKYAANLLLKKHMKKYKGKDVESGDDPYFALIEDPRRPGKFQKVKKQVPAYIPEHDAEILGDVRRRAYVLDVSLFNLFGIRFGWESVIGFIPVAGDVIGAVLALMLYFKCCQIDGGLPFLVHLKMLFWITVDVVIGLLPFVGDLLDALVKCNTRNLRSLEKVLDKKYKPSSAQRDERDLVGVDREKRRKNRQSGIYHPSDPPPATAFEDFDDEEEDRRQFVREQDGADRVPVPVPARAPEEKKGYGWFSGGGRSSKRDHRSGGPDMRQSSARQETGSVRR